MYVMTVWPQYSAQHDYVASLRPYVRIVAAAQKKTSQALSLINKRFKISRYRRWASAFPMNMPVWSALEKDPRKKPPRMVKRLDGTTPTATRRTKKRIRSKGEVPTPRKKRNLPTQR